jgi:hypothetical protein
MGWEAGTAIASTSAREDTIAGISGVSNEQVD